MADKVDLSLDDIIKKTKPMRGRGRGRGSFGGVKGGRVMKRGLGGNRGGGFRGQSNFMKPRGSFGRGRGSFNMSRGGAMMGGGGGPVKLTVSNLDFGVTDEDIRELFREFGEMRRAAIHYDRSGRSLGVAEVMFGSRASAMRAISKYNGVPLDGRQMVLKMTTADGAVVAGGNQASLRGRLGGARGGGRGGGFQRGGSRGSFSRGGRGARGGRGGRGGGRGGNRQPTKTKEQLDAEMDEYNTKME